MNYKKPIVILSKKLLLKSDLKIRDQRKMAPPNGSKWNTLVAEGYKEKLVG